MFALELDSMPAHCIILFSPKASSKCRSAWHLIQVVVVFVCHPFWPSQQFCSHPEYCNCVLHGPCMYLVVKVSNVLLQTATSALLLKLAMNGGEPARSKQSLEASNASADFTETYLHTTVHTCHDIICKCNSTPWNELDELAQSTAGGL